ncbi:hypothetical protein E3N88_30193 [Mikania micrantha]|uniref:histone acetyltransferase n=1 Tax=Mikania micrantha TaxID=192012 RepID=A0A5N6ML40_9ASTR|nr:hypothetical protein E3N88_30193 [Mikania micrantha]
MVIQSGHKRITSSNREMERDSSAYNWHDPGSSVQVDQTFIDNFAQNHLNKTEEINHLNTWFPTSIESSKQAMWDVNHHNLMGQSQISTVEEQIPCNIYNYTDHIPSYGTFVQPWGQILDPQQLNQWNDHQFPLLLDDQIQAESCEPVQNQACAAEETLSDQCYNFFMVSEEQSYESWVDSCFLREFLTSNYLPVDLPPLEQGYDNSEEIFGHEVIIIKEDVMQPMTQRDTSENIPFLVNPNICQLCFMDKLLLNPAPKYCSSCDLRIKQNAEYYRLTNENSTQEYSFCMPCFKGSRGGTISSKGDFISKSNLHKTKNDDEREDSWVQCDRCKNWQHRICGLYNNETDSEGKAEYICPKCCLKEIENGTRVTLPKTVVGAQHLPTTNLSDHIEQRLRMRLKQEREETAQFHGIELKKVPEAKGLVVRVAMSVDKELEVRKQFRDIFYGQDYPEKTTYRSKLILLFQRTGGVDVCLFGMFVQEFGSDCEGPNKRSVYVSHIDSVKYFEPERKTASGESLRTFVYHEILIGYLEYCKKRGFATCYVWACPPKDEDYIFYCHPKTQKTPQKDELRQWYKSLLKKAAEDGIVVDQTNLYNQFFDPEIYGNAKISAARLPYFDGDYWSEAAESISKKIDEEERLGGLLNRLPSKRKLMAMGHDKLTRDALVMQRLGKAILPSKENFMIIRLQHICTSCHEVILSGSRWSCKQCNKIQSCSRCYRGKRHKCHPAKTTPLTKEKMDDAPLDTKDNDEVLVNNFLTSRNDFLNKCQISEYQFHTLSHAKYSSMMILYHLINNLVDQPKGDTCHTHNSTHPSTSKPKTEQPQNQYMLDFKPGSTSCLAMWSY